MARGELDDHDLTEVLDQLAALRSEVAELRSEVAELRAAVAPLQLAGVQLLQLVPKITALVNSRPARALAAWNAEARRRG